MLNKPFKNKETPKGVSLNKLLLFVSFYKQA